MVRYRVMARGSRVRRPRPGRRPAVAALAAACMAALAICSGPLISCASAPGLRFGGGSLVVGVPAAPDSPNPYLATSSLGRWVGDLLLLPLARQASDFTRHPPRFTPALASRWEIAAGGREVIFHLDPRAQWSDGKPVTPTDVIFTWKIQTDPVLAWPGRAAKRDLEAVEAIDARTIRFRFRRPSPNALMNAAEGPILPAHRLRGLQTSQWSRADWSRFLVYSGPYLLSSWDPAGSIRLAANPHYLFEALPLLDKLELRVITDPAARAAQLMEGRLDLVVEMAPEDFAKARQKAELRCESVPDLQMAYIGWNSERIPLGDVVVRRALSLAVDRQGMVRETLGGAGRPASGPILSHFWIHDPKLVPARHDLLQARRLLDGLGFRDRDADGILERAGRRFTFKLAIAEGDTLSEKLAMRVYSDLQKLGVDIEIQPLAAAEFARRRGSGDFDAYLATLELGARLDLAPLYHSSQAGSPFNDSRLVDATLDTLIERAGAAEDLPSLTAGWREVEKRAVELQPYTFLIEKDRMVALSRRFADARFDVRGPLATLEHWQVQAGD